MAPCQGSAACTARRMLQLEQSTNLQVSEKGETDYSHDMLSLNSSCQIWACVVNYRRETSVGSSRKGCLPTLTFILC